MSLDIDAQCSFSVDLELTPPPPFQITAIALQSNDVLLTWNGFAGTTNVVQAAGGAVDGSYSNDFLNISPPIIIPTVILRSAPAPPGKKR